jgi:hypothetical protein
MAEDSWKTDTQRATPPGTVYKQVAPAGLASEVTADDPVTPETISALGRWLAEKLAGTPGSKERIAALSGLSVSELDSLINGHPLFPLDTDHVQRLATALVEAQIIPHAEEVWNAIGDGAASSDYLVPPAEIVRAMSDN